jgi:hypothetical protein
MAGRHHGGMKLDRLFHVLVVVGGASAAACETDDDVARRAPPEPDAAVDGDAAQPGDGEAGQPCFCDQQACCDRTAVPAHVLTGFTCCWSTTCP